MGLDEKYHVIFIGGGASTQFALIPMNFLPEGKTAAYVDTGTWSTKAIKEAKILGNMHLAGSSKEEEYRRIPKQNELDIPADAAYFHITTNNTIKGTQWHYIPDTKGVPLIADMSSDILSHRMDFKKFSLIYAGAQKNLGPSGATMVVIHDDFLAKGKEGLPSMLTYKTHTDKKSLYNTPPAFGIYVIKLVMEWIKKNGGLAGVEKINEKKQALIYGRVRQAPGLLQGHGRR